MNLKQQALQAHHVKQETEEEKRQAERRDAMAAQAETEAPVLKRLLFSILGVAAEPDSGAIEIDGLRFEVWAHDSNLGYGNALLLFLPSCTQCGAALDGDEGVFVNSRAELGAVIEQYANHKCGECYTASVEAVPDKGVIPEIDSHLALAAEGYANSDHGTGGVIASNMAVAIALKGLIFAIRDRS